MVRIEKRILLLLVKAENYNTYKLLKHQIRIRFFDYVLPLKIPHFDYKMNARMTRKSKELRVQKIFIISFFLGLTSNSKIK